MYGLMLAETMFFSNTLIFGWTVIPDLMLFCIIYLAIQNGSLFGEVLGFASGLMLDFFTAGPFGLNCLIRTLLGFAFGFFRRTLNSDIFLVRVGIGAVATVLKNLLILAIQFLYPSSGIKVYDFLSLAFRVDLIGNVIACPVLFLLLSLCKPVLLVRDRRVA
jgi:rod shape-determining protein MreD